MRSTSFKLYKMLPTNLGACKPTFYTFHTSDLRWNSGYEALFLSYRPRTECSSSHLFNTNCTHLYSGRWKHAWAFSESVKKKIPKSPIRPAGSHFLLTPNLQWELSVWMKVNRVTLHHSKDFFLLLFNDFRTMCNL